jgi:hypothetical protein
MLRRGGIIGLVVSLALAGSVPVSACAMLMELRGQCAPPAPPAAPKATGHCHEVSLPAPTESSPAQAPDAQLSAQPGQCCCVVRSITLPAAQSKEGAPTVSVEAHRAAGPDLAPAPAPRAAEIVSTYEHSPPDLQPVLCVFLI